MIVSTTSTIENFEIAKYLDPITSHLVAGTNYFSDFAAGFTDIFGGRSETYQKQISNLYKDAIAELKNKASKLKANALIGVSVDLDEISGKGKSMFMITAIGTPVIFKKYENVESHLEEVVLADDIIRTKKIIKLKTKIKPNAEVIHEDDLAFIINNSITELIPTLMKKYEAAPAIIDIEKIQLLVAALPDKNVLYDFLDNETSGHLCLEYIKMIRNARALNFERLLYYLVHDDFVMKKLALEIVFCYKDQYTKDDIDKYNEIKQTINNSFPERGKRILKKGMLSKEKEMWQCECGKVNDLDTKLCMNCAKDVHGFLSNELKPSQALSLIDEQVSMITELLNIKR